MNKLLAKFVPGGFVLALLLLTGAGAASYLSIEKSIENKLWVEHTRQVLEALDKTLEGLNDAERGRRGYIITSKKSYLKTYKTGIQTSKEAIQAVRKLTSDNPRQQERLHEIEPLIAKILALLQKSVDSWQKKKLDTVTQIAITEEGRKIRETLQEKLNLMDLEERKLLQQRSNATDRSMANTIFIGGISYFLSLSLLSGIYYLLKMQIRISQLAETELKKQTQMLDLANDTIIICDLEDKIIYWNQGAERLYGWTKEEAIGQEVHQLLQTSFLKSLKSIKNACLEQGYWEGELKHLKRDRTPITVASRWTLERDEEGKPIAILEINNDISKRDRAEKELRESEERWQLSVRGTNDGIWDLNIKTNQIYYSPRWKEMLGYEEEEISDRINEWIDRIHPEDLERVMGSYHQHLLKKIPFFSIEHRLHCKDGNYKWILSRGLALWDEQGNPIRISGSHTDISDRKTAEIALHRSQIELSTLLENTPDVICRWDRQLRNLYINTAVESEIGITPQDLKGKTLLEIGFYVEIIGEWESCFRKVFETGEMNWIEFYYPTPGGEKFYQMRVVPEVSPVGNIESILTITRDITKLKEAELTLQHSKAELALRVQERTAELREALTELQLKITELQKKEDELNAVNRALWVKSECDRVLIRAKEEISLVQNICETIVEIGGYHLAWVGYAQNDAEKTVLPIAKAGYEADYLQSVKITWTDDEFGQGPSGTALRTSKMSLVPNVAIAPNYIPWREAVTQRSYSSSIALPLLSEEKAFGVLNIYAREANAFDAEEVNLLQQLANNLSFGIMALRTESARQQAEDELKQQKELLQTIFDHIPVMIAFLNAKGEFLLVNREWERILGWSLAEANQTDILAECYPDSEYRQMVKSYIFAGDRTWQEFKTRVRDGRTLDTFWANVLLPDGMSIGIGQDITDRKRAETSLRQSERRYATLTETVPVGIFRADVEGNNLYHNERWCQITGLSVEESQGKEWVKGLHPDDREQVFDEWYRSLRENIPFRSEHRLQRPDGVITWVFAQSVAERDANGELIGFVGTLTDITDRKKMEQSLKDARDELEIRVQIRTRELTEVNVALEAEIIERREAERKLEQLTIELKRSNHELEQFAYIASHDLQEPLRAVTGYTQLLAQEYQNNLDDSAREYVSYIVDGASRMRQLIQDLLAYSRVGTQAKEFAVTDCNLVLAQAIANLQVAIAESNASISFDSLPTIIADSTQLIQLFQNLVGNAIKFCRDESPQVRIWAELKEDRWLFAVSDNGIGIKPQYLDRIFEIFKRLHTRREFPGTGIGLAICKKIVERHGGLIWAESQPGVGTIFYFTIPLTLTATDQLP